MNEQINFDNQIVLISGAGRGLGAAYALAFAQRGATVVVHDAGVRRDGSGGDETIAQSVAQQIIDQGGVAEYQVENLATKEACAALIHKVVEKHSRLDVLVHSAGLVRYNPIDQTTDDGWQRMLDINIQAPFWLCRAVWPTMKQQRYGRIVLTVSGFGLNAFDDSDVTAYGVGKAAQFGLMNGLAGEGKRFGIQVNAISPVAATRIFRAPVKEGELTPEDVSPAVVLLGSKQCPWNGMVIRAAGKKYGLSQFQSLIEIQTEKSLSPEQLFSNLKI